LQKKGPMTSQTMKKFLPQDLFSITESEESDMIGSKCDIGRALRWAESLGEVEYGHVGSPSWRKSDKNFSIPSVIYAKQENHGEADILLAQWYFDQYSPSTLKDFTWWCGWPVSRASRAFKCVQHQLVKADIQGYVPSSANTTFYLSKQFQKDLEEIDDKEPIVMARFLPYEDALLKAYKLTRNRFYSLEANLVESNGGEAKPTVWLNGTVIGRWTWKNTKNKEMTVYLDDLDEKIVEQLKPEAEIVKQFIEASNIVWMELEEIKKKKTVSEKSQKGNEGKSSEKTTNSTKKKEVIRKYN